MSKRHNAFSKSLTLFLSIVFLIGGIAVGIIGGGIAGAVTFKSDEMPHTVVEGELQIHFLELGNKYTGDCIYIKAGETDVLIDAGSRTDSIEPISNYLNQYVTDGKLEYVIVTHAHQDHYAGFAKREGSLFDLYECGTIIDFPLTNQVDKGENNQYGRYLLERNDEIKKGATHYTADEALKVNDGVFDLGSGVSMKILDNYFYHHKGEGENNYSVCTLFTYGDYNYLFTGDLEKDGEEHLVALNDLPEVTLYKAGHHGSKTSSSKALLEVIKPQIICVCCCAGSPEYTKTDANQFPTQIFVDNVAPYTDKVYVTSFCEDYEKGTVTPMNGTIAVVTTNEGVKVNCLGGDDRVLKDFPWFKEHRTCPTAWK